MLLSLVFPPPQITSRCFPNQPKSSLCVHKHPSLVFCCNSNTTPKSSLSSSTFTFPIRNLNGEEKEAVKKVNLIPKHVAVIMDGNARWAKQRNLPSCAGHEAGVVALTKLYQHSCALGIRVLTVYFFSCDNWNRPQMEVVFLMSLLERYIEAQLDNFIKNGVQLSYIGEFSKLPKTLQKVIAAAVEATKNNKSLQLILAVSYSGQFDIVQACQSIAKDVKDGSIQPQDIVESLMEQKLQTNCTEFPYPDLLIRTSGELRLSNFLLWQMAYAELYFAESLWPDFGETELVEALRSFQSRQRRYGKRDCR